ncbi:OmpA family protein [Corallincola luteus]|uniref:OmpA family protein n=1 Tax=Corallincola luteus TaxID=1775177 RepID=A0ABY2ALC1_9GAMM|nr:OmpA family protein [Corallincola luteus]TCI03261.1 OmpA family protein [Corallincola luteus]
MRSVITSTILISVLALSGCQTTRQNAITGEEETNSTTKGALLGCAGGALLGAMIKDKKAAAIGCVAGGATGGAIGYQLDEQEAALRKELVNSGVQVQREDDRIRLIMRDQIAFETGKSSLSPAIYNPLNSVAKVLGEFDDTELVISGHTDSTGSDAINDRLSNERAMAVLVYMRGVGVESRKMHAQGYGKRMPMCSNDTQDGRACNRRVELELIPASKS